MRDDVSTAVGQRVREAMRAAGLTQQQVATQLGITQGQLSRRLAGKLVLDVFELHTIARMCGVPAASFLHEPERAA